MDIEYFENKDLAVFDGKKFRLDKKTGYYLKSTPPRARLHRYVWEYYNGKIEDGFHIHHKDEDKSNNELSNLEMIQSEKHLSYHGQINAVRNHDKLRDNIIKYAIPKAKEWHSSEEGRNWHSMHQKETIASIQEKEYTCQECNIKFYKKPFGKSKFCSNKCKSMNRRKSGIDNDIFKCIICGSEFSTNKYSQAKYCSDECRSKKHIRQPSFVEQALRR